MPRRRLPYLIGASLVGATAIFAFLFLQNRQAEQAESERLLVEKAIAVASKGSSSHPELPDFRAAEVLKNAAAKDNPLAQAALALMVLQNRASYPDGDAYNLASKAHAAGVKLGTLLKAWSLEHGKGVTANPPEAFELLKSMADISPLAQARVAKMHYSGVGALRNWDESLKWAEKAALNGKSSAQMLLANLLYNRIKGIGTFTQSAQEGDRVTSYAWYLVARTDGADDKGLPFDFFGLKDDEKVQAQEKAAALQKLIGENKAKHLESNRDVDFIQHL